MKVIVKSFASNRQAKKDFMKACHKMAQKILGDAYDKDLTEKTARGIMHGHKSEGYDAMIGIFRNGLRH